ncbi:P-loop containing nucleoside triphosphate hydrolase protein [Favolaschia claudopus]|uniref:P-loop containing nucleoside triphosphate hydrolase protein n=1 Tax=Favolaschia claudopus TaxID=2862362 RepID=A0AAW0BMJ4_9AGAR
MGFRAGFHLEKQDCERRNVALIVRVIRYTSSGLVFLDLEFLVPPGITKASDVPKYLVFVQSIEQGHRVVNYLRSLLPAHLQKDARKLIRHHHSMACPECKAEGMESLYKCGEDRDCLVHVSTDVLTVGVDIPGLAGVVIFDKIQSLSALLQRAGRPVRERGTSGFAYIYVSKANMAEAMAYLNSEAGKGDKRVLEAKDPTSYVPETVDDSEPLPNSTRVNPAEDTPARDSENTQNTTTSAPKQKPVAPLKTAHKTCASLLLVFAAHARNRCVTRQINIIYRNPEVDRDCGRCSSCVGDSVPKPRETETSSAQPSQDVTGLEVSKVPGYMKPQNKDLKTVTAKLEHAAYTLRQSQPACPDALLISARIFLPPNIVTSIITDFLLIESEEVFFERVRDWKYKDEFGGGLWNVVKILADDLRSELITRHDENLEKQRIARLHKWIVSAGLEHIKRVSLKLGPPPPRSLSAAPSIAATPTNDSVPPHPPENPANLTTKIPPTKFYAGSPKRKAAGQSQRKGSSKRPKRTVSVQLYYITVYSYISAGQRKYGACCKPKIIIHYG